MIFWSASWLGQRTLELLKTVRSLAGAVGDYLDVRLSFDIRQRKQSFAFLVHPRTDNFYSEDVYGKNDIFRPFPALNWLKYLMDPEKADRLILRFSRWICPITLSRITVKVPLPGNGKGRLKGYLLSTVRTPKTLMGREFGSETRDHLRNLFALAASKGVERVGLGALLPAMTKYGLDLQKSLIDRKPSVSTGHAYTGYVIVDYLRMLISRRDAGKPVVRVAIMGAAGSTGKSVLRNLIIRWGGRVRLDLVLVDLPAKETELMKLVLEARACGKFVAVRKEIAPEHLLGCKYVVCVTNSLKATILPEHVSDGTVIIDDSQPRNTTPALMGRGVHVLDVLARVNGLDVGFDFGFKTRDKRITFTCLAETIITAAVGLEGDLAVGEVTPDIVRRVVDIVDKAEDMGLIGELPFMSFGREMSPREIESVLDPEPETSAPTAPVLR